MAQSLVLRAMQETDPLAASVKLLLHYPLGKADDALGKRLAATDAGERMALLLLDALGESPEKAALWMQLSVGEVEGLKKAARRKLLA